MIKDVLQDIVKYTHKLGVIDLVKITGTDKETDIMSLSEDKSVIIYGKLKSALPDFVGVFGMPNMNKLNTILGFDVYDDKAQVTITRVLKDNVDVPISIHFETNNSDFVNDYRLMSKVIVEEKMKTVSFKGANWHVTFNPTINSIARLKKQATANNDQTHFVLKTENNNLKIYFGDMSTHSGNLVFQDNISGTISKNWSYPVKVFLSIMDLPGDKTIQISDQGVTSITVDSGLAVYTYLLPASQK